ncbi:putative serine/threonine-protein kinase MEC1 like protein [Nosema granulosis]|uniref:Serine/threonine-protein kinase MEC1 like protein n=1 Tax=Nosema granulosis TaxID=83296 RepID=A0A9P6H030_9MICR|nr:putative serine/threonine-protein kinase MEC1 like protein [Nosema granulosis]
MSIEYTKNLYKQKITFGNYVQILIDCCDKVVSLDLINTILIHIVEDKDQKRTHKCLEIFMRCLKNKIKWPEMFVRSEFLDILNYNRLEYDSYTIFRDIMLFITSHRLKFGTKKVFEVGAFENRFYNYAIYKEFIEPHRFDAWLDVKEMDAVQIGIYKNILRDICISNRDNTTLREYLDTLDIEIEFHKAIMDRDRLIDVTNIPRDYVFVLYPHQVRNISNLLLSKFFLCSSQASCRFCGRKLLPYEYDSDTMEKLAQEEAEKIRKECCEQIDLVTFNKHRRFLEPNNELDKINETDFEDLAYFIIHERIYIGEELIKVLLRATNLLKDNSLILECFSQIDMSTSNNESVILYYVKNLTEKVTNKEIIKEVKHFLRIYDHLKPSKKVTFGLFVLLFECYRELKDTRYPRDFILNTVLIRKNKLRRIIKWILEYYISKIDEINEDFAENFTELAEFLSEERLVEQNMNFIYPIVYSKLEFVNFTEDPSFNERYSHYVAANYIMAGDVEGVRGFYKEGLKETSRAVDVLVPVLLSGFYDTAIFKAIYGDWDKFVSTNIVRILFETRKRYFEQFEQTESCVFFVLRNLLTSCNNENEYNLVYPFIESFIFKGCGVCQDACVEVFVKFFVSQFQGIPQDHIKRMNVLFDFERMLQDIKKNTQVENLKNVLDLVSSRGYLRSSFSEKALILFRSTFSEKDQLMDEKVIENYVKAFLEDVEVSKVVSKIYERVEEKEMVKLMGYIPTRLLYREQKDKLRSEAFLQDNLNEIARMCIEKYAMNIEIEDQDLHCFIIQEIHKYLKNESAQFNNTKYTLSYEPVETNSKLFKKSYGYEEFLENLFSRLLFRCKKDEKFYNFFKYGNLLGIKFLEFSTYQLFNKVVKDVQKGEQFDDNNELVGELEDILKLEGVNYKIIRFLVNLDIYTKNRYFETGIVLEKAIAIKEYYYSIFLIESIIRKNKSDNRMLFNTLQFLYYKVGDSIRTRAINTKFFRINPINLFFEFILDRNLEAARDCLGNVSQAFVEKESFNPHFNPHLNPRLVEILNEKEEEGFLLEISTISEDLSEWRNIQSTDRVCLHFLKDCEMVEKSRDLPKTLEVITERRRMAGDDLQLIKCHEYLKEAINKNISNSHANGIKSKDIRGSSIGDLNVSIDLATNYSATNNFEHHLDSATNNFEHHLDSATNNFEHHLDSATNNFEQALDYSLVRKLVEQEEFGKATKKISQLLAKKDWGILYEFSELYLKQKKMDKSKECLKKMLNLFPKSSPDFRKACVRHAELVDSRQVYEEALGDIKDSAYLYLLYAKNLEGDSPVRSMEFYISSLLLSEEYKYETIPRLFHILSEMEDKKGVKAGVKMVSTLDSAILLPFFSQILIRINHKTKEISEMVERIILRIVEKYPRETHWRIIHMMENMKGIIPSLSLDNKILLSNIKKATEILSSIAQCTQKEISIKEDFPEFYEVLKTNINIPNSSVEIVGIENEVKIFSSLQSPKKITLVGSDGKKYQWLCKYRDDLRKDSRFMDLNRLVNRLLQKNTNSIRTYEVIPFSHKYGIIEFIEGLVSFKSICNDLYSREGISISATTKKFAKTKKIRSPKFREVVLGFPPVFYRWFEENFLTPYNWYLARDNYTKTCAVMNIMGWFMGLGDRHAENILFDINLGDTVHVDLNCIFESAKKLSIPERVPFRLTQNMVDAFGVLGLEGVYTTTMRDTLGLFLQNKNIIISNLLSFVYDPLHEWKSRKEKAPKQVLDSLEKKLSPTDVTSKVEQLNEEAMAESNLGEMYIGWLPFL